MTDRIRITIPCPVTSTENENHIAFIEPLRKLQKVYVGSSYLYNLGQFYDGLLPYRTGHDRRYEFIFLDATDATAFKLKFGGEEVK